MAAKILVVDDESDVLLIVKTALTHEGFQVVTAASGPEGIAAAKSDRPDLILLDLMMPGMDGFEALACLKADEETCRIPVIMLTGVSERAKIQEALVSGIDYYVVKPFEITDLLQKIKLAMSTTL